MLTKVHLSVYTLIFCPDGWITISETTMYRLGTDPNDYDWNYHTAPPLLLSITCPPLQINLLRCLVHCVSQSRSYIQDYKGQNTQDRYLNNVYTLPVCPSPLHPNTKLVLIFPWSIPSYFDSVGLTKGECLPQFAYFDIDCWPGWWRHI